MLAIGLFSQTGSTTNVNDTLAIQGGIGLGTVIAVVASWSRNESILWAILHGILSWFYVIHFALAKQLNS